MVYMTGIANKIREYGGCYIRGGSYQQNQKVFGERVKIKKKIDKEM